MDYSERLFRFRKLMETSDTENRLGILRETNPRQTATEATQRLNPLTGRAYENDSSLSIMLDGVDGLNLDPKERIISYMPGSEPDRNQYEFLNYQFALAKMDVRDGKMEPNDYFEQVEHARTLVQNMKRGDLPLDSIDSANGLEKAMRRVESDHLRSGLIYLRPRLTAHPLRYERTA